MNIIDICLKSKNNPNIFVVTDEYDNTHVLHADVIVEYGVRVEADISEEKLSEIYAKSDIIIATNQAMKYISSRLKTTKQLREYLQKRLFSTDTIDACVAKLLDYHILDDEVYAQAYIRLKKSGNSKLYIAQHLSTSGVSKDIAQDILCDVDESSVAISIAEKHMASKPIDQSTIAKLVRHLQYKGFGWDSISAALRHIKAGDTCQSE